MTGLKLKFCSRCFKEKEITNFGKNRSYKDGYRPSCKECRNKYEKTFRDNNEEYRKSQLENRKRWEQENPDKAKKSRENYQRSEESKLKSKVNYPFRKYGITYEEVEKLRVKQDDKCLLCNKYNFKKGKKVKLVIDHCHVKDEVRGLLCSKCNQGLGLFDDNVEVLQKAIAYLKKEVDSK
jgi:hypothetical protein